MSTTTDKETTGTAKTDPTTAEEVLDNPNDAEGTVEEEKFESESEGESEVDSGSEDEAIVLPTVEELMKEREQLKAKVEEWKGLYYKINDAFQKKSTEVQDTRKRLERMNEVNQAKLRGQVVSNIFSPFENLKRSLDACTKAGVDESLTSGLGMVKDEFWTAFQKLGLEEIPGVGSLFNPNIHEALTTMPVTDPVLNDTVVQVYTAGYRINDTVVRTAQVIVGKYTAPPKPVEESGEGETIEVAEPTEATETADGEHTPSDSEE